MAEQILTEVRGTSTHGGAAAAGLAMPSLRWLVAAGLVGLLAVVPLLAAWQGDAFLVTLVSRMMIYALAAVGLNLVMGFGGMVSFGHAMYIGLGAYAVGILQFHGIGNGYVHLVVALGLGAAVATGVGWVCLRVSGVGFIMITLAFAQMLYFVAISLKAYGGDDGFNLAARSDFGWISIADNTVLYYVIDAALMLALYLSHRALHSRFGMALRASRSNERRLRALGMPTGQIRLIAYVASALVCVLAGVLLANTTRFVSPSYMQWSVSGELIVMAVLGGMHSVIGPVVGAVLWLALEELLSSFSVALPGGVDELLRLHWMGLLGLLIVGVALGLKDGLYGWLVRREEDAS